MPPRTRTFILLASMLLGTSSCLADAGDEENPFAELTLRHIGPAITSGRVSDFAIHPDRHHEIYAAVASGNLWKTTNNGITWEPIFENEGSYAIGVVTIDPSDPSTLWVGTGENNAQRSVAYGDGVYKSNDGGKTWRNVGLGDSGHISQIWIDPEDSGTVLVAAQGPLWSDGGDRGLFKTTDGGTTWEAILSVDQHTGVNEFVVDPRNHDNIVVSTYQRRRHVWVLINGGPGSGIHKSSDGGATWKRIEAGLPEDHMGRIGLAGAPSDPDTIYAIIEANDDERGIYRSTDFGESWEKRSDHMTTSPQYYNEIVVDPLTAQRLYSLDTFTHKSEDGGETWAMLSDEWRHVDDHALWIDPERTEHLLIGGDGGIYESWDRGKTWRHVRNLSITQFYRIHPDNDEPFYNVCGGTQDNNSLCAPSRTTVVHGITNSDWTFVLSGDGYKPQFDPNDPNIIYTQYQYGGLARYDRRTRERVPITPHPGGDENQYKWNWNAPLLVSPHSGTRLFYAGEKIFQSDDRGDSWRAISPDLTRQLDRNKLEVMGRVWSIDTIAKNDSTSMYGSIIGLSESPLAEGLLYAGSDDGLISVTEDGGANWRSEDSFPGVPDMSLVEDLVASVHDADVAYAVFDNHKRGDYKPYVYRTDNRGRSWEPIVSNLPKRGSAHTLAEDHVDPNLLFVGTEFGLYFSQNRGESWLELDGGFPTIAVRDIEIQRRESDLVIGTFGRGIYILDDYSPLRTAASSLDGQPASLFPVRDAWLYVEGDIWDGREKGSMGAEFFSAPNPDFGAVVSYYLAEDIVSAKTERRKKEIELEEQGADTPYPPWDTVRAEDTEEDPSLWLVVRDPAGNAVRQVKAETGRGFHRTAWDLRLPAPDPVTLEVPDWLPYWETPPHGPLALPGEYTVSLALRRRGEWVELAGPESFRVKALEQSPEITTDRKALQAFQLKAGELYRAVAGAVQSAVELQARIDHLKPALVSMRGKSEADEQALRGLQQRLVDLNRVLSGDDSVASRNEPIPWTIAHRAATVYQDTLAFQSPAPAFYEDSYEIAAAQFEQALAELASLHGDLDAFEKRMEQLGAPWTPGRVPDWEAR